MFDSDAKSSTKPTPDYDILAEMFVEDFFSLTSDEIFNKWRRYGGTHLFPPEEIIHNLVIKKNIELFLSSEEEVNLLQKKNGNYVRMIRDIENGREGYRILFLEDKDLTKGKFYLEEDEAKYGLINALVLTQLNWDYYGK
jgi:hypothetical protein